jgi:hypothetical protein
MTLFLAACALSALVPLQDAPAKERILALAPAAWCDQLAPWKEMRERELDVEIVPLEDVLAATAGDDAPERIKRYLYEAWKTRNVAYALLVGDADTFPVRFMVLDRITEAAFDTAFYPSDLYYADLAHTDGSFDDWNAAIEGPSARYFGEVRGEKHKGSAIDYDGVSYVPEIAVGRWPVSSAEELGAVVTKTIDWEKRLATHGEERALLAHAAGWIDARATAHALGEQLTAGGFVVEEEFFGTENAPDPERIVRSIAAGLVLAVHLGHGSSESWEGCLGAGELARLAEIAPAIFVSIGCNTGELCVEPPYESYLDERGILHRGTYAGERFDAPPPPPAPLQPGRLDRTGLGERLMLLPHGGAAAYIGCCTGAQPCALTLLDGFLSACAEAQATRIGDAWNAAVAHYVTAERLFEILPDDSWYPASVFFQGMKFLLYGDPALRLR